MSSVLKICSDFKSRVVYSSLNWLTFHFTLLFSHLADAFIQKDLQIRKSN